MKLVLPGLILAVFAVGCSSNQPPVETPFPPQKITFNSSEIGRVPRDFTTALTGGGGPVSWVVREAPDAPVDQPVLVQESAEVVNYRFPLCVYDKAVARDVAVEVKFKPITGTLDQAGGVVLRYTPGNYYIARANALENNIILFKTVNGVRSHVKEVSVPVSRDLWHTLRFEAKGPRLKIIFDGKTVLKKTDRTFTGPGRVGMWTKADSVTAFTDFKVEPAPAD